MQRMLLVLKNEAPGKIVNQDHEIIANHDLHRLSQSSGPAGQ